MRTRVKIHSGKYIQLLQLSLLLVSKSKHINYPNKIYCNQYLGT